MGAEPDEKTEAAIDDFRFLVLSLKQIREPSRDLLPHHTWIWIRAGSWYQGLSSYLAYLYGVRRVLMCARSWRKSICAAFSPIVCSINYLFIVSRCKDTNKRAKNQRKTCFSLFFRARVPSRAAKRYDCNATLCTFRSKNK